MLTTVQQLSGSVGLTLGGLVFYTSASHDVGFARLLVYEVAVFAVACAAAVYFTRSRQAAAPRVRS
jgi:hypothetical protein